MNYSGCLQAVLQLVCIGLPAGLSAQNIINSGAHITMNGSVQMIFHDAGLINNGNLLATPGSAVSFTGSLPVAVAGSSPSVFDKVNISKSFGGTLELQQDVNVNGTFTMNDGNVLLNTYTLNLGSTGSIEGESSQSHITGKNGGRVLMKRKVVTPMNAYNPGNIGVVLTSSVMPGNLIIERRHVREELYSGVFSIQRSFAISSSNNSPLNATLRFYYLDEELTGNSEADLNLYTKSDVSNSWTLIGRDGSNMNDNWVEKSQLSRWGRFTLGGPQSQSEIMKQGKKLKDQTVDAYTEPLKVQVYPNPSADIFNLVFSGAREKDAVISLYNQEGQLIQQKKIHYKTGINTIRWNLAHQAAGIYFITDNTGMINVKLIKQ